jgi:hypothetical protein
MAIQKWIMSEGGPLIAVERELRASWGGICRLTVPAQGAANDYDRPPQRLDYIQTIDLDRGQGLVFGEGPVDTTFFQESDQLLYIVRVIYCNLDFDLNRLMTSLDGRLFDSPIETIDFRLFSGNLSIFDSAEDGSRSDVSSIDAKVSPGLYRVDTVLYQSDEAACSIIHRMNNIS